MTHRNRWLAPAALFAAAFAATPAWAQDVEEVVAQATRSGRSTEDDPIRVEVLGREEIEEKLMMVPGNIAMLVSETPGVRTQITSPSLGAANIRMQGMKGRYTQLLADGLPIYGGQAPAIGLLQIPPTDLGQVEIIKGAASALYGPSALGGVINLVSRRPGAKPESEFLVNATSRNGQDVTAYSAAFLSQEWGYSLTGGFDRQTRQDLNSDGWADMPGYTRWTARPRLFWERDDGAKAFFTADVMTEQRQGGTLPGHTAPDGQPFPQRLGTTRYDGGVTAEMPIEGVGVAHFRASGVSRDESHRFGSVVENDHHYTIFGEASLTGQVGGTSWLAGAAFQRDTFHSDNFSLFNYNHIVPGLLAQVEHDLSDELTLAGSARWDDHNRYGSRLSPRLSLLYKPGAWNFRASLGQGFFAPTPFVEGMEETGLSRLLPLGGLKAEIAKTASLDAGYTSGPFTANLTLFASDIKNAVQLEEIPGISGLGNVRLFNAVSPTRTRGGELMFRYRWEAVTLTGSYVYTDASEMNPSGPGRRTVPLTPRQTAGLVGMWEEEGKFRIGLESYFTGRQLLEDNPYRSRSVPYFEMGAFGEVVLGNVRLYLNLENLLDVRQTKYDPLLLPQRAPDGRWTVDAWAPTDGFAVNGGVRVFVGD
jgi:iron complex outermembrane receptor protein